MIGKGIFEIQVNGQQVGFKFGMYASGIAERENGCSIYEIFRKISEGKEVTNCLLHYFYGGYVSYCASHKTEACSLSDFSDLLEQIEPNELMRIYNESLESPKSKNETAPNQSGHSQLKTA